MGGVGSCGVSANECSFANGPQINFGDLTPYLTYLTSIFKLLIGGGGVRGCNFEGLEKSRTLVRSTHTINCKIIEGYILFKFTFINVLV